MYQAIGPFGAEVTSDGEIHSINNYQTRVVKIAGRVTVACGVQNERQLGEIQEPRPRTEYRRLQKRFACCLRPVSVEMITAIFSTHHGRVNSLEAVLKGTTTLTTKTAF